jgi:hypothetical protein
MPEINTDARIGGTFAYAGRRPSTRSSPWTALALGFSYAIVDLFIPLHAGFLIPIVAVFVVGFVLGLRREAIWFWIPAMCLFAVHVLVIVTHLRGMPYVEDDLGESVGCLLTVVPLGIGTLFGKALRGPKHRAPR